MAPVGSATTKVNDGNLLLQVSLEDLTPEKLAGIFADAMVLVQNQAGAQGNFGQYAKALSGLNGPAQGDHSEIENSAAVVIGNAIAGFDPARFRWEAGRAPSRYVVQLRDLAIAQLRRLDAKDGQLQSENLKKLSAAYAKLESVGYPSARGDEYLGKQKIPKWSGSVWKDTYAYYKSYSLDRTAVTQYAGLSERLARFADAVAAGQPLEPEAGQLIAEVRDFAEAAEGVNKNGLPERSSTYSERISGWND